MSMIDVLKRVDAICKKYDRYDADKQRNDGDPFSGLYAAVDAEIDAAIEFSLPLDLPLAIGCLTVTDGVAAIETMRPLISCLVTPFAFRNRRGRRRRRTKAWLLEEVVKLHKIAAAKKVKELSPEKLLLADLVAALPHRIQTIPDSHGGGATHQDACWNARPGIKLDDYSAERLEEGYFHTTESEQFRREHEMRRIKQDEWLDFISQGLDTLKNLAEDMNEELDRQVPLMDEIDVKVDKANLEIRITNVKLKQTVNQFRSTRNFTIDIILISIILGIATYVYNILSQ